MITAKIPANYVYARTEHAYPTNPQTIGEHIRKRRMDLKLEQKEVARRVGRSKTLVFQWEHNKAMPGRGAWPAIVAFLGYDPFQMPT